MELEFQSVIKFGCLAPLNDKFAFFLRAHRFISSCGTNTMTGTSEYQRNACFGGGGDDAKTARRVLVYILDTSMRLLYPHMLFVMK
jgi:hypothetical protein